MQVLTGTVVGGQVVVEGGPLPEGRRVAIYVEEDEGFPLDETSKRGLAEAMAQFERGEALTPEQVFARLRSGR